jgi:hypothetical protein
MELETDFARDSGALPRTRRGEADRRRLVGRRLTTGGFVSPRQHVPNECWERYSDIPRCIRNRLRRETARRLALGNDREAKRVRVGAHALIDGEHDERANLRGVKERGRQVDRIQRSDRLAWERLCHSPEDPV